MLRYFVMNKAICESEKGSNYTYFSFTPDPLSQLHSDIKMNLICWVIPSPCFQFSEDEGSGFSEQFWLRIVFSKRFLETLDRPVLARRRQSGDGARGGGRTRGGGL